MITLRNAINATEAYLAGPGRNLGSLVFKLKDYVQRLNPDGFERVAGDAVTQAIKLLMESGVVRDALDLDVTFHIAGYHYISYSQGNWFRFVPPRGDEEEGDGDGDGLRNAMAEDFYDDAYGRLPREKNLFVSDRVRDPLCVVIYPDEARIPRSLDNIITVRDRVISDIRKLLTETHLLRLIRDDWLTADPNEVPRDEFRVSLRRIRHESRAGSHLGRFLDRLAERICRKDEPPNNEERGRTVARLESLGLFAFSAIPTITFPSDEASVRLFLVLPFAWENPEGAENEASEVLKYGSFGAFVTLNDQTLSQRSELRVLQAQLRAFQRYAQALPLWLFAQEMAAGREFTSTARATTEDVVRRACVIDQPTADGLNRLKHMLPKECPWIADWDAASAGDQFTRLAGDTTCYSQSIIDLMMDIKANLRPPKMPEGGPKPSIDCVFLCSSPGCGKEWIAFLCHLMSGRGGREASDAFATGLDNSWTSDEFNALFRTFLHWVGGTRRAVAQFFEVGSKEGGKILGQYFRRMKHFQARNNWFRSLTGVGRRKPYQMIEASYQSFVCSQLTEANFQRVMFGSRDGTDALLLRGTLLGGSVFLDEFNTMDPKLADRLLRTLESPFELRPEGWPGAMPTGNVLLIFASNETPDELIDRGVNRAVITRITRNYWRIPPLRDRPEDIAVFINSRLLALKEKSDHFRQVRRVQLEAMRLLCELPWEGNYREIGAFIGRLKARRVHRDLRTSDEVTFAEVLSCLRESEMWRRITTPAGDSRLRGNK